MSYHGQCHTVYGGVTNWDGSPEEKWNSSLSPDQIAIMQHTLRVFYDKAIVSSTTSNEFQLGGYESLYLAGSTDMPLGYWI